MWHLCFAAPAQPLATVYPRVRQSGITSPPPHSAYMYEIFLARAKKSSSRRLEIIAQDPAGRRLAAVRLEAGRPAGGRPHFQSKTEGGLYKTSGEPTFRGNQHSGHFRAPLPGRRWLSPTQRIRGRIRACGQPGQALQAIKMDRNCKQCLYNLSLLTFRVVLARA